MGEQLLVVAVVYAGVIAADWRRLRKAKRGERAAWAAVMAFSLYLAADLLLEARLPHADAFVDWAFGGAVQAIERWFTPAS